MNPALVAIAGPLTGATFDLAENEVTIGRHASNRLRIPSTWVSRRHCRITRQGDECAISDLDSSHGSFVNAVPVKARVLKHGDRIAVSASLFLFVAGALRIAPEQGPASMAEKQLVARTASHLRLKDALYLQPDKMLGALSPTARPRHCPRRRGTGSR